MQRYILFLLLAIVSISANCDQQYISKLATQAMKRHDYLTNILEPKQCRAYCDSMDLLGIEKNEPTLIYLSEHIKYLLCLSYDSTEEKTMYHLNKCKDAAFVGEDSAGGFDMWSNEVIMNLHYGHNAEADEQAQKLIEAAKKSGKSNRVVMAYFTMSNVKSSLMDNTAALYYAKLCAQKAWDNPKENQTIRGDIGILMATVSASLFKWKDVIAWADTTIKYDPNYREAYYLRAHGCLEMGDRSKFKEYYNIGEEMGKKGIPCVQQDFLPYYHAIAQAENGNFDAAITYLDSIKTRSEVNELKRCLFLLKGDYKSAYTQVLNNFLIQDSIIYTSNNAYSSSLNDEIQQLQAMELYRKDEQSRQHQKLIFSIIFGFVMLVLAVLGVLIALRVHNLNKKLKFALRKLDISNRKVEKANEQLELASEFKDEMTKQLSSQIRADMNLIKGYADLVINEIQTLSPTELEEAKNNIETGYNSVNHYLHDMDESAKEKSLINDSIMSTYKVNDLARQAIKEEWARPWEECPVNFSTDIDEDCLLYTDYYRLKAIIRRAIHYIYIYGNVEIINVTCKLNSKTKLVTYIVSQNHNQLPDEVSEALFDRYFTYNGQKQEGLFMTRKLANTIEATIWYEKNKEGGETIKVTIPLHSQNLDLPSA